MWIVRCRLVSVKTLQGTYAFKILRAERTLCFVLYISSVVLVSWFGVVRKVTTGLQEILLAKVKDRVMIGMTDMLYGHGQSPPYSESGQYNKTLRIKHQEKSFSSQRGPTKSKPFSRAAVNPSAPPPNPIIPPIIATTLYWPFWFPDLTHKLGISFIFYSKPPTGSLPNPSSPLYLLCDLDKTEPLFSSRNSCPGQELSGTMTPYVDAPECADVPADLRQPKCYSCYCRFSDWEICWLRPVACPIWTAAGPIWLSNLGGKAATQQ